MKKWKVVMCGVLSLSANAWASKGPFDSARLHDGLGSVPQVKMSEDGGQRRPSSGGDLIKRNILCGIKQDSGSAMLCIDGVWADKEDVEKKYKLRIVTIENISVVLSSRKKVTLGESISMAPLSGAVNPKGGRSEN